MRVGPIYPSLLVNRIPQSHVPWDLHLRGDFMKRILLLTVFFCSILSVDNLFGQASNGQVGGTVQDASKALIPGVTVTLTNKATGVADTRLTNEAGAYNFPSVLPGTYTVAASLTGFKTSNADGLVVNTGAQVRWNFNLEVGGDN